MSMQILKKKILILYRCHCFYMYILCGLTECPIKDKKKIMTFIEMNLY